MGGGGRQAIRALQAPAATLVLTMPLYLAFALLQPRRTDEWTWPAALAGVSFPAKQEARGLLVRRRRRHRLTIITTSRVPTSAAPYLVFAISSLFPRLEMSR